MTASLNASDACVCLCILQVADDESDELVEQINLHGNFIESMDGLEAFSRYDTLLV